LFELDIENFARRGANALFELLLQVGKGHDKSAKYSAFARRRRDSQQQGDTDLTGDHD
jgi:hypothetical protein